MISARRFLTAGLWCLVAFGCGGGAVGEESGDTSQVEQAATLANTTCDWTYYSDAEMTQMVGFCYRSCYGHLQCTGRRTRFAEGGCLSCSLTP
jgi:hypothetical protein